MPTILVVDDNDDIRSLIKQGLEMEGYEVLQAENGRVAQARIQDVKRPCLVLLDLMMPVMDGHEFLEWKNNHAEFADIDVVVLSAAPADKRNLRGADQFLRKPVDFDVLLEIAKQYLV